MTRHTPRPRNGPMTPEHGDCSRKPAATPSPTTERHEMSEYEDRHRIALARELTYAAGFPLRDRYGFAASDVDVLFAVNAVFAHPGDKAAADAIGYENLTGDLELASGYDTATDEEYELGIVAALRPLVDQRRDAAARSLS